MSEQYNQVSSATEEPILLDVLPEELRKCLQIEEEFVWVDMPDALQENARTCEHSATTNVLSNISNIEQSDIDYDDSERETDDSEYASKRFPILDIELYDTEYEDFCQKNRPNLFKPSKTKYPMPHFLKVRERGVYTIEKRENCNEKKRKLNDMTKNEFLPAKFDESTTAVLNMLVKNRYLRGYDRVLSTGKNYHVLHAVISRNRRNLLRYVVMPFYNAVKIYKTSKNEETNRIIYRRVQREFEHLNILSRCPDLHYRCPSPGRASENVIVMEFVGYDERIAPSIADLPSERDQTVYNDIIDFMDKCYNSAHLVHGNLSASKILYQRERLFFIGWSHSVKRGHPQAQTKLMKDCQFVTEFFRKRGLNYVKSALDIFKQITKQEKPSDKLLEIIQGKSLYEKYDTNPNRNNTSPVKPTNGRFK